MQHRPGRPGRHLKHNRVSAQSESEVKISLRTTTSYSSSPASTACSASTCYTTAGYFGVKLKITYSDHTTEEHDFPYGVGYGTTQFIEHTDIYTPPKSIQKLVVEILLDGNGDLIAMWDDLSLVELYAP